MRAILLRAAYAVLLLLVLANPACLRKTEFQCADDSSCGPAGNCESTNFCSFADPSCPSGRSYDQSAGSLAGQCTGGNPTSDGGNVDTPMGMTDSSIDAPPAGCPAGYNMLTGGTPGHLYKLVTLADDWMNQQSGCKLTSSSSNLAIPDDIAEHTALDTLANGVSHWVGITDSANEGTFLTVFGAVPTYLPWTSGAPDNNSGGPGEDCVESLPALHQLNDRRCNLAFQAICECVPPM